MNKKTAIVTGASRGIGKAAAIAFAKSGYNVIINYNKSEDSAIELKDHLFASGCECEVFKADVGIAEEAQRLIDFAVEKYGKIDTLVNNAGISQIKLFTDITPQDWDSMVKTNLSGVFYCTQSAVKEMLKYHSGNIINISSMWGQVGASCEVPYSTAKAGLIGLTRALAKEVGPSGITVNCIAPGLIDTEMNAALSPSDLDALCEEIPLGRLGTAEEVAALALFLSGEGGSYITGQVIAPNGGMVI